jgi:small subunit ribosomal protein S6
VKERLFEIVFLVRQDVSQAQARSLAEDFQGVLKEQGGQLLKEEYCGLLSTAYPIRKNKRAHYFLFVVKAIPGQMTELERRMRLSEDVLRHLCVRVEEFVDAPSKLLQTKMYQERFEKRSHERPAMSARDDRTPSPKQPSLDKESV